MNLTTEAVWRVRPRVSSSLDEVLHKGFLVGGGDDDDVVMDDVDAGGGVGTGVALPDATLLPGLFLRLNLRFSSAAFCHRHPASQSHDDDSVNDSDTDPLFRANTTHSVCLRRKVDLLQL